MKRALSAKWRIGDEVGDDYVLIAPLNNDGAPVMHMMRLRKV
jgi:hypothetical protein